MKRYLFSVLAVLVTASAFAFAAQAEPISPVSPLTAFGHPLFSKDKCTALYNDYMQDVGEAVTQAAAGNTGSAQTYLGIADAFKAGAKTGGCSWAS